MIIERDITQMSPEWFQAKCGIPSASHFGEIITPTGNPLKQAEKYMYRLAAEAVSGIPTETYQSAEMRRGIELEQDARMTYEAIYGVEVEQVGLVYRTDLKTESCSPDGLVVGEKKGLEIKCPSPHTHVGYLLSDKIPTVYIPQVQGSLWITGYDAWVFMSFCPGVRPLVVMIEPDLKYISLMEEMVFEFNFNLKKLIAKIS